MEAQTKIRSYRDLVVWQKGIALARAVYRLTAAFPDSEKFGLVSQMRRAAVSVPSNIAEGQARRGKREFLQFLSHAGGSLAEVDTQLILSAELGFLAGNGTEEASGLVPELQKMLFSLRQKLAGY
ncbi:MAG TPA: four helix bundle protein [Terriglobia bacterium]|nr:four helix bundle protein [Terriglobia bacterium]